MESPYIRLVLFLFAGSLITSGTVGCNNTNKVEPAPSQNEQPNEVSIDLGPKSRPPAKLPDGFEQMSELVGYRELNPVPDSSAKPGFDLASNSGIDFENQIEKDSYDRLIEAGAGLAIADYDNDGNVDIYFCATDGVNRLFRGLGEFKFEDVTDKAKVDGRIDGEVVWAAGASFADIDNDGDLDLFVCNMAARNILYENLGDGTFADITAAAGVGYFGGSKIGSFCDYDRDGDLDLYLLTNQDKDPTIDAKILNMKDGSKKVHPDFEGIYDMIDGHLITCGEKDILYQNDGNGKFTDVTDKSGIEGFDYGLSATWFDYDGDDWLDIYVANDFKGPDKLYRNLGDGTFKNVIGEVMNHMPWFSMGSAAGDLNNDGFEDLMVVDMSGSNHYKQKVNMGEMGASGWFLNWGHPRQYMRNSLYFNTGTGRFLETAFMSEVDSTDWSWAVRFADFDLDGLQDIYVTNGHARDNNNSDFSRKINELKKEMSEEEIDKLAREQPPINETNVAFKNKGDFHFESIGADWNLDLNGVSHGAATADFDRDGDLDIVVNNLRSVASVYRNRISNGHRLVFELRGTVSNFFAIGSKVEVWQDGNYQQRRLVPVSGYLSSDEPILHFGFASDSNLEKVRITWPNGTHQELTDVPLNRIYHVIEGDLVEPSGGSESKSSLATFKEVTQEYGISFVSDETEYDDYAKEPLLPNKLSQLGPGAAWGDVNQDGFPDVYIGGPNLKSGQLYINQNGTSFSPQPGPWNDDFLQEDMGAVFFDADNDGDDDLYVVSGSNEWKEGNAYYRDRLYLNDGEGKFSKAPEGSLPDLRESGSSVSACDFDQDGDIDLFVGTRATPRKYPVAASSRILRNNNGKFEDATSEVNSELVDVGLVSSGIWTDFNNDGWIDLMLAMEWGPVRLFENQKGKFSEVTEAVGLSETLGWWHGVAAGDFDRDGDLDYIAVNHGLNTKYHCSKEKPHRLYYQDFDNNGSLDLVEAEYEGQCEFPIRGRSCSSHSMPFIAEKFESFHDFAMAEVSDIYTEDIKNGPHLAVTDLQSVVIWNEGGKFEMEPLPAIVQLSPGFGLTVSDFDGDGWLDVIIGQNFFGPQPETGYADGGVSVMLRATADRKFEAVWPKESGLVVAGDATAATSADIDNDGDRDVLVITNNGPMHVFQNQTSEPFVSVPIEGSASNPILSLTIVGEDFEQRFETVFGEGYLGNSSKELSISRGLIKQAKEIVVTFADGKQKNVLPESLDGNAIEITP